MPLLNLGYDVYGIKRIFILSNHVFQQKIIAAMKNIIFYLLLFIPLSIFSQDVPDSLNVYIEDKDFMAGDNISLEVWSDAIDDVSSVEFSLTLNNGTYQQITASEDFIYTLINFFNDKTDMRALGYINVPDINITSMDVESSTTWITMEITPNFDGSSSDLFNLAIPSKDTIHIEDENDPFAYYNVPLKFSFSHRDITYTTDIVDAIPFDIFPNPVENSLFIQLDEASIQPSHYEVYNQMGQLLISQRFTSSIDTGSLPSGTYALTLKSEQHRSTRRFVKK